MSFPDWLRKWVPTSPMLDRLHYALRHDSDTPIEPDKCADTACMALRALADLAAQQHEALVETLNAITEEDSISAIVGMRVAIQAGEDFKKQHE